VAQGLPLRVGAKAKSSGSEGPGKVAKEVRAVLGHVRSAGRLSPGVALPTGRRTRGGPDMLGLPENRRGALPWLSRTCGRLGRGLWPRVG